MVRKTTKTLYSRNNLKEEVSINDFVPKIVLGKGAFGTVLLVEKKDTKELFAMKSINKDDIVKKDQIEHTKTEKMILEHVNHPYLVGLAYAFQTSNKLYFIMQFMSTYALTQREDSSSSISLTRRSSPKSRPSSTPCRSLLVSATSTPRTSSTEISSSKTSSWTSTETST
jgi:serine/threonine protein kinase